MGISGTNYVVKAWTLRPNPVEADTDGDGFLDGNDPNPRKFDTAISEVYGDNVLKFNTGAVYSVFGSDVDQFYREYRLGRLNPYEADRWEALKSLLDINNTYDYTHDEMALICSIDINGAKNYLETRTNAYKAEVYHRLTGVTCTEEQAAEYFAFATPWDTAFSYLADSVTQILKGKFSDKVTLLGTIGEIGLAFTGGGEVSQVHSY